MNVRNRRSVRQIVLSVAVPAGLALMAVLAPVPAAAYTQAQRAACEGDALKLCGAYVQDINQITACMKRNRRNLSTGCRAVFNGGSQRRAGVN